MNALLGEGAVESLLSPLKSTQEVYVCKGIHAPPPNLILLHYDLLELNETLVTIGLVRT